MPDGFYNHLAYFLLLFCFGGRGLPFSARAPPSFEVYSMKLKIQEVYDGKKKISTINQFLVRMSNC